MGRDICFRVRCIRVQDVKDDGYLEVVFSRGRSLIDGDREVLVLVRDGEFPGTFFPGNVGVHCNHKLSKPQHYPKNIVFYSVNHSVIG